MEALRPLEAGILSERRSCRPFGLMGGGPALPGINLVLRKGGRVVSLGELKS
jgi:5-oxoprolinase (ATP-hydrolysing)